jgi:DNA-directed RNA polymerase III subunit RPC6
MAATSTPPLNIDELVNAESLILELITQSGTEGVSESSLQADMPQLSAHQRLAAINRLSSLGKIDLLRSRQSGLILRLKDNQFDNGGITGDLAGLASSGNQEEMVVFTVIREAGTKGIWIKDIAKKTNVRSTRLNKTLKSLESKRLIKSVTAVNANTNKVNFKKQLLFFSFSIKYSIFFLFNNNNG